MATTRVQVILTKNEWLLFKVRAERELKSLSAWFRDIARDAISKEAETDNLRNKKKLKAFFQKCAKLEHGKEPSWEQHKEQIINSAGRFN